MMSDPHIGFVIAAYSVAAVVIAAMIGSVVLDYRRLSAHLDQATRALESRAAGRRTAPMSAIPETARRPRRWLAFLPLAAFAVARRAPVRAALRAATRRSCPRP